MSQTRIERKEQTRRAILDAALALSSDSAMVALSLRQVAKEVGIVPTAFYRHFASIDDLGLALVEESLVTLRSLLRRLRQTAGEDVGTIIDGSVDALVEQFRLHRAHYAFIARERFAGSTQVREAIAIGIGLAERDLADDLAAFPVLAPWTDQDRETLASLIVMAMVGTVERLILLDDPSAERLVADRARTQLRMVLVGTVGWRSAT